MNLPLYLFAPESKVADNFQHILMLYNTLDGPQKWPWSYKRVWLQLVEVPRLTLSLYVSLSLHFSFFFKNEEMKVGFIWWETLYV